MAIYTVSPDVPGLIVGCIGSRAEDLPAGAVTPTPNSALEPVGRAHLWRTRDGGAHWQVLALPGLQSGCKASMPTGGHGTIFVMGATGSQGNQAAEQEALLVSHDSGDNWRRVDTTSLGPGSIGASQALALTAGGIYRDGVLYSYGRIPGADALPGDTVDDFSASADDGSTWTYVEHGFDRSFLNYYGTIAIAADYRAPRAWFRVISVLISSTAPNGSANKTLLEHSADGGKTWQVVGSAEPDGVVSDAHAILSGALATTPAQPSLLCIASRVEVRVAPGTTVNDDLLIRSSDAGVRWNGASFQKNMDIYDNLIPRVAIDQHGDCYTADYTNNVPQGPGPGRITIWRLRPGPQATPSPVATADDQIYVQATIFQATPGGETRLLLIAITPQARPCSPNCRDGGGNTTMRPRVFWKAAPT
jgi:hypothetical protein